MEKLKMHSPDLTERNIDRIAELFPTVITETIDAQGNPIRAIDFDMLRQELSDEVVVVEGAQERYQLDWPGKRAAAFAANAPIAKTLRPVREESVDFDTTKNLFIEGDNLDALKLLQESYLGRIKLIYIDPPYNTGNDFVYEDDFAESSADYLARSGQKSETGERLVANTESNGRFHSDWLSMMYPRLKLARNLLANDGALVISIDDNESANLRRMAEEVFGPQSFVAQLAVQVNPRGRHLDRFVAKTHESLLVFVRDPLSDAISGVAKDGRMADEYDRIDGRGPFRLLGLRNRNQSFNPTTRPNLYYPLYVSPMGGTVSTVGSEEFSVEVMPDAPDGTQTCWTWSREKVKSEGNLLVAEPSGSEWRIFRKDYLHGVDGEVAKTLVKSVWLDPEFSNDYGRKAVKDLFGKAVMDFPKSPALMRRIIDISCPPGGVVLDFFAGSSSMAQAVMETNASDAGGRRFIMIQLDEPTAIKSEAASAGFMNISALSRERIRRAGAKVRAESGMLGENVDVGFRSLHVATTNMADTLATADDLVQAALSEAVGSVKPDRTDEDLLFQVLLNWGLDLAEPIAVEEEDGLRILTVADDALIACFADEVTAVVVRAIAERRPLRAVFKDSGFATDAARINAEQIFRELSPETEVRTI
ncbi:site-specific DNA-methyltransferase [Microbacterium aurum]